MNKPFTQTWPEKAAPARVVRASAQSRDPDPELDVAMVSANAAALSLLLLLPLLDEKIREQTSTTNLSHQSCFLWSNRIVSDTLLETQYMY